MPIPAAIDLIVGSDHRAPRTFGMVSTFPPTACGIATFAAALSTGLLARGDDVDVVRCGVGPELEDPLVVGALGDGDVLGALSGEDVVFVQHEYGIYDGPDGDAVLAIMRGISSPMVLVAHTVLTHPSAHQRAVLRWACAMADAVVVMTETAHRRLVTGFGVPAHKVSVIPHGAATPPATERRTPAGIDGTTASPRVLTWGLLGPGKGIEWAIDAFGELGDLDPAPTYVIAGATHPKVKELTGESYREMLVARAEAVGANVVFDDSYRDLESLTELIRSADLVVLPYDSVDQVTSGVLVDAVAAGRPVVSTAFPHAVELLSSGAGIVVAQRDPAALAAAIRIVLTDPNAARSMAAEADRLAPGLSWPSVADRYAELAARVAGARAIADQVSV